MELFKLATGYTEHKLYRLAADSYLTLGREFPGSSMLPGDQALSMAGNLYRMAFEIDASRQAYQEVVDRYPGTQSAATASTLLETLPE